MNKNYTLLIAILILIQTPLLWSQQGQPLKYAPTASDNTRTSAPVSPDGYHRCLSVAYNHSLKQRYPNRMSEEEFEKWLKPHIERYEREAAQSGYRAPVLTIPTVVHVIHNGDPVGSGENITDNQVISQITVFNEDFRRMLGTRGHNTDPDGADVEIEFCLATIDPSGNPTNGINRVDMGQASWNTMNDIDNNLKPSTQWNPDEYLNMWSVRFGGGMSTTLGYAQFPDNSGLAGLNANGGAANSDGVVAAYTTFGSIDHDDGTFVLNAPYNLGRTMTHEVGHWLGLRHIWGDAPCGNDDFCADTPESDAANFNCPTGHSSCSTTDMVENYMDYSNDACMNIFTDDQKTRMRTVMSISPRRSPLTSSTKCGPIAPFIGFVVPTSTAVSEGTDCSYQDIVLDLSISQGPTADATVTFGLDASSTAVIGEDIDFIPNSVTFLAGATNNQQVTVRVYNDGLVEPNEFGLIDFTVTTTGDALPASGDPSDHQIDITDDDFAPVPTSSTTLLNVDFESGAGGFTALGNAGSNQFQLGDNADLTSAFWTTTGNTSTFAFSNDDDCNCNKANDRLISPTFSLVGAYTTATLTFDHAFSDVASTTETAEVQISTGGAWTTILTLSNTSTEVANDAYSTPWVNNNTVDISSYIGNANVQVRFRYDDGGNWSYGLAIDNVEVTAGSSIGIQVTDNTAAPKNIPVPGMGTVHFYDPTSGDVMGTIQNTSTWDYQCTTVEVDRDLAAVGGPTAPFWNNNTANHLLAKTFYVSPTNNTPTGPYTITLYFTDAEISAWEAATGQSRNNLQIIKVQDNPISTVTLANHTSYNIEVVNATVGTFGTDVTLTASFNTGFSGFGAGIAGTPDAGNLPLQLLEFDGQLVNKDEVQLHWLTQNEVDIDHFILEHSTDGINYSLINEQAPKGNGLGAVDNNYNYLHSNPSTGINYYRLKEYDIDGHSTYYKVVAVEIEEGIQAGMRLMPNPVVRNLTVAYNTPSDEDISIEILNVVGQKMMDEQNLPVQKGINKILLNLEDYANGVYFIRIKQGLLTSTERFVKK